VEDGKTVLERGSVLIKDACISEIRSLPYTPYDDASRVIDTEGCFIIPGAINNHAHDAAFGPMYHSWSDKVSSFFGNRRQPLEEVFIGRLCLYKRMLCVMSEISCYSNSIFLSSIHPEIIRPLGL
jgi:cytosine/adenosine deaminase-related metal-dependent hydrolase